MMRYPKRRLYYCDRCQNTGVAGYRYCTCDAGRSVLHHEQIMWLLGLSLLVILGAVVRC